MLQIPDFWTNRINAESQNLFIRELAEFYYNEIEIKLSIKLNAKAYEYIIRLLMSKYDKLKEGIEIVKNDSNRMVVQGLIAGRQRVFQSWVCLF